MTDIAFFTFLVVLAAFLGTLLALFVYGWLQYRHFWCCNQRPEDEGFTPHRMEKSE